MPAEDRRAIYAAVVARVEVLEGEVLSVVVRGVYGVGSLDRCASGDRCEAVPIGAC